jgi:hypothetical protein
VKREAYEYASRGAYSPEIDMLGKIERFGLEAITGRRQFYYGELRRLLYAESIVNAYKSRARSKNWVDWVRENPGSTAILSDVENIEND